MQPVKVGEPVFHAEIRIVDGADGAGTQEERGQRRLSVPG